MQTDSNKATQKKTAKKIITEMSFVALTAMVTALLFRSFVLDPFFVPSASMVPSLLPGDRMFATKWPFGYSKHSFPARIVPFKGKIFAKQPKRGEIVIFAFPGQEKIFYVKRVVGLPGDKVQVVNNVVYVNKEKLKTKTVKTLTLKEYDKMSLLNIDPSNTDYDVSTIFHVYEETSSDKLRYQIINSVKNSISSNTKVFTVPKDHCFVMGDNRNNSMDSRFDEVGFIPLDKVIAKPVFIFFSSEKSFIVSIFKPSAIRWKRMFKKLSTDKTINNQIELENVNIDDASFIQA
ncbi:MAG: signal peptidase I [Alphaproteobacteria bacterium]|nr:signal peptidase I [Rickettsiales bacterium]